MVASRLSALFLLLLLVIVQPLPVGSAQVSSIPIVGIASWYGGGEKLNLTTANGEVFDSAALTCASWDFPFGTLLNVTNRANGRSVQVRVNDRGPARRLNRLIDLSRGAFSEIADPDSGLAQVEVIPDPPR